MYLLNNYKNILCIVALVVLATSCNKWLEVQPEDKITEQQTFSNPVNVYAAVNSIYINIAQPSLYGENLTMTFIELLAQRYNVPSTTSPYLKTAQYDYNDQGVRSDIESIWSEAYKNIASINNFLQTSEKYPNAVSAEQYDILKGELYGLRAFLHFDLLRLFGPIYGTKDSTAPCIPYYSLISSNFNNYLPANNVMDSILKDIKTAELKLANDPIIKYGVKGNAEDDPFFQQRNYRMNYYAVKALEARVSLYRGNKTAALEAATEVINNTKTTFPWITVAAVTGNPQAPNRIFSPEIIFGGMNRSLYSTYQTYFSPTLLSQDVLAPLLQRLKEVYEDPLYPNDLRYDPSWIFPNTGDVNYKAFYKYADVNDKTQAFRFTIPLIRISELYYIAAECEKDTAKALGYVNSVRYNRAIANLTNAKDLQNDIRKEYLKEFYGEGQLFYYYKRTNTLAIPNGSAATGTIAMTPTQYVLPIPQSEIDFH